MTPAERQARLAQDLLRLEDPQERLTYVQDRVRRRRPWDAAQRTEDRRIQSCATRVWLAASMEAGLCVFEVDSESAMVRGLATLICEVYSGTAAAAAAEFECRILEETKLEHRITPTRLHGLAELQSKIRAFARDGVANLSIPR